MLVGHQKKIDFLKSCFALGKFSHAYLFSGPEGVGKFTAAWQLARELNGERLADFFSSKERPVDSNISVLEPARQEKKGVIKEKEIKIDFLREALKDFSFFSEAGKKRWLIIRDAHKMNLSAQNALLKALEEPQKNCIIILTTHQEGKILSTIQSRCQKIKFNSVPLKEIKEYLERKGFKNAEKIAFFSMGRPGWAVSLAQTSEKLAEKENDWNEFRKFRNLDGNEKLILAEKWAKNIPVAQEKLRFWIWFWRAEAYKKLVVFSEVENFYTRIEETEKSLKILEETDANPKLVLENLFLNLE